MSFTTRPTLRGCGGAVSSGHYLATSVGARILGEGGNAADAACAMGFALQVLEPHMNGPAGEAPILYYDSKVDETHVISGQGVAPASANIKHYLALGLDRIPGSGFLAATVPAAMDAWCLLLERFGTLSFEQVTSPARGLCEKGFPSYRFLRDTLLFLEDKFRSDWPTSAELFVPVAQIGAPIRNMAYGNLLGELADSEKLARGTREQGIRAARDSFYNGRVAEEIESFLRVATADLEGRYHSGLLTGEDLASYHGCIETPLSAKYRDARVFKCPPWSQGLVFLQQLRILEGFDLSEAGFLSPDALHIQIEAAKLAFADREANYGDPRFVDVPTDVLLSDEYNISRCSLINRKLASFDLRPGLGSLPDGWPWISGEVINPTEPEAFAASRGRGDTTHLDAVDSDGNLVSATPSGGWILSSPVIPSLGFPIGTRGQMFSLDPEHPNSLVPKKRPRTTLSPSLAILPDGRRMAFGTPGGDQQDQWTLQFFLSLVDYDCGEIGGLGDLQSAIDAPTVHTMHMPSSFYPRNAQPGWMAAEERIPSEAIEELASRGHRVVASGAWQHGRVMAVTYQPETGLCEAASSPRSQIAYSAVLP